MERHLKLAIIGSGPAGMTAAIYACRANLAPVLFRGPIYGGQLSMAAKIENYPGFPESVPGYEIMDLMEKQARNLGTEIIETTINDVDFNSYPFILRASNSESFVADAIIIATGCSARLCGVEGEDKFFGKGVSTCATCDGNFYKGETVAVIGGGSKACNEAEYLSSLAKEVFLVFKEDKLQVPENVMKRVAATKNITIYPESELVQISGDDTVTGISIQSAGSVTQIACKAVFVAVKHGPNSELFREKLELDKDGFILTKDNFTNIEGVFAAGDIESGVIRQAVTAAASGCKAAIEVSKWLKQVSSKK